MTRGKMLGGSSSLDHMLQVRGIKKDFDVWKNITGDNSWSYDNLLPYFKKFENVLDEEILANYSYYHGVSGRVKLSTQRSTSNLPILGAFKEFGHNIIADINSNIPVGYSEPLLAIGDGYRQSAALAFMANIQNRTNLHVMYNTKVRDLFDSNNTATGVEIVSSDNVYSNISAVKKVIVSAGAIHTPDILTKSGVGIKDILDNLEIPVVVELPVGKNLIDHSAAIVVLTLGAVSEATAANYQQFPAPVMTGYVGLNSNDYPDYQSINLVFEDTSSGLIQLCAWVFKYSENICQKIYDVNKEQAVILSVINVLKPKSRGQVITNSTDLDVNPIVTLGLLSDENEVSVLGQSLMDFSSFVNSSYFQRVNSKILDFNLTSCEGLDKNTLEFFECYALGMSSTMWHYSTTCAMGTVLNSDLTVKNTKSLRVVDASAMPDTVSGNILAAVYALAEKAADMIKATHTSDS